MENRINPKKNRIALVLQGGGALGAYQAGIYQALHEHDLAPDWIVGTSIGAINAALIAGNPTEKRLSRLQEFWERVGHTDTLDMQSVTDQARQFNTWLATLDAMIRGVPGFFSPRLLSPFAIGGTVKPEEASFYKTDALVESLGKLIDFDYLNAAGGMRLTVNALKVTCGELVSFDNQRQTIGMEHIMASGALPPGFPPVRIDGELYWDGGLYSNTPLETVLEDETNGDMLCFMVDLWSANGPEPTTLEQVQTRQKDVMFASRSKRHIDNYLRMHNLQSTARELYNQLPKDIQNKMSDEAIQTLGCDSTIHIVHLPYSGRDWHMASKDINFSKGSIAWRWEQGYRDATRAIKQASWLSEAVDKSSIVVHQLAPYDQAGGVDSISQLA
jgi:NTE family protein